MTTKTQFDASESLGAMSRPDIGAYLTSIGNLDAAAEFNRAAVGGQSVPWLKTPFTHTGMLLGYMVPEAAADPRSVPVKGISHVPSSPELVGQRIKLTMDKFYVHSYPGLGTHKILCEFAGKNQVSGDSEELRFALRFEAADKGSAAILGAPIFLGLTVGPDGISFEGRTVNVGSKTDEAIMKALDSAAFKSGLTLIEHAQPALKPFAGLAKAVVESVCSRNLNRQVHNFNLGLDFSDGVTAARLALGAYVVVQTDPDPDQPWDWSRFVWNSEATTLQLRDPADGKIDFNYMIFSVRKFSEASAPPAPAKAAAKKRAV